MQPGGKIMIVDDDVVIRTLLDEYLCALGYIVETADGAAQCLELMARFAPDAAVIDLQMTGMNGLELLRLLSAGADPGFPVIMLSADDDSRSVVEQAGLRADAYMQKPFDMHEMRDALAGLLRRE